MPYWYPTQARADVIAHELSQLKELSLAQSSSATEHLPLISEMLQRALALDGFPKSQIGRWIWLASQFRLLSTEYPEEAALAGSALNFLNLRIGAGRMKETDIQDLNWVLDSTTAMLNARSRQAMPRSCLSAVELVAIEIRLAQLTLVSDFDAEAIRSAVSRQVAELEQLSTNGHLVGLSTKIEALFAATERSGAEADAARAALLYLAQSDDVVSDGAGILGLLDDLYVIDWAFAVVESQTRCLPLLQALLDKWPFVADIALAGDPIMPLDRFGQLVACACLQVHFGDGSSTVLVLRENGGYCGIAAFFAAVQCARLEGAATRTDVASWDPGQAIIVGDGEAKFRAVFKQFETIEGKKRIRLGVRDRGSLTVDIAMAPYMARSKAHKHLSDGKELGTWLKTRHLDPLIALTGIGRQRLQHQQCVLLLGPQRKLRDYFAHIRPFGVSASALLGAKYVSADMTPNEIGNEPSDVPFVYACSDPDVAVELIRAPPAHVSSWRVIVDGGRRGLQLGRSLEAAGLRDRVSVCVYAELHERDEIEELSNGGHRLWYLEDQDVQPPSLVPRYRGQVSSDPLERSLARQGAHWNSTINVYEARHPFLEAAAACLGVRDRAADEDPSVQALEFAVSSFIRMVTASPLQVESDRRQASEAARNIVSYASSLRIYHDRAATIMDLFQRWRDTEHASETDKRSHLLSVLSQVPETDTVAVVCRSEQIASRCRAAAAADPALSRIAWTNLEELRVSAPFDVLLVTCWLDRMSMREIYNNRFSAALMLILYPFENRWFDAARAACERWERRIESKTTATLRRMPGFSDLIYGGASLWRDQAHKRLAENAETSLPASPSQAESPEFEQLEARAISALQRSLTKNQSGSVSASARLVLFQEIGSYAFLPPAGKVIVLDGDFETSSEPRDIEKDAERLLFRSVSSLQPGMILAFSKGSDRDLLDARTDQQLPEAVSVRRTASLWKVALQRNISPTWRGYADFAHRMAERGEKRDPSTVRAWATHTHSIAPRNYRVLVPLIAELTGDAQLGAAIPAVLQAIDLIYRARTRAAVQIVEDLFSGEIDLDSPEITFDLDGAQVTYSLYHVRSVGPIQEVPVDVIGRIGALDDHLADFSTSSELDAAAESS